MSSRRYLVRGGLREVSVQGDPPSFTAEVDGEIVRLDARVVREIPGGVEMSLSPGGRAIVLRDAERVHVWIGGRTYVLTDAADREHEAHAPGDEEPFAISPMTGVVSAIRVAEGDTVAPGEVLFVIEAMKMEFAVDAPREVVIASVEASPGDRVDIGQVIARFVEPADEHAS